MDITIDELAAILHDCMTWRQLRQLAKREKLKQYSYLRKEQLAMLLAITTQNKKSRHHAVSHSKV
jgi:hypothetical protein